MLLLPFLAMLALANVLQARVVPDKGSATEPVSARTGLGALDPAVQQRLSGMTFCRR